ncbi:hypothetical protein [Halomarina litorea]|uniref:hypothetical protein n=1 Tax=Halomarina litorea TaxID=2961595 RepID=UPI0020C35381|nr:hypothetical protein [Halomarina sp. BCD28]
MRRQSVAAALCVLVVLALATPLPGGGTLVASGATAPDTLPGDAQEAGTNNSTLGESVTSFMQVSTVETASALDRGMWRAAYRRATSEKTKARLLAQRLETLDGRLDALEARLADDASAAGPTSLVRTVVLAAEAETLRATVESTVEVVDNESRVSGLDELRERARGLDAPPAPSVPGAGVADDRRPPRGPNGNASGGGNSATADPDSETGPPGNATGVAENASDRPENATSNPVRDGDAPDAVPDDPRESAPENGTSAGAPGQGADTGNGASHDGDGGDEGNASDNGNASGNDGAGNGSGNGNGSTGDGGTGNGSGNDGAGNGSGNTGNGTNGGGDTGPPGA